MYQYLSKGITFKAHPGNRTGIDISMLIKKALEEQGIINSPDECCIAPSNIFVRDGVIGKGSLNFKKQVLNILQSLGFSIDFSCCDDRYLIYNTFIHKTPHTGSFSLRNEIKRILDFYEVSYDDSCCQNVNEFITVQMKTFIGDSVSSYPRGVFNVNGVYLGIANDQSEYITLWNSDPDNQLQGELTAGMNAFTFMLPKETATIDKVVGLRWYQFDILANRRVRICLDVNDVIVSPDGQLNGSSGTYMTASALVGNQVLTQPRAAFGSNAITHTYVGAGTIYVFHNDSSNPSGFMDSAVITSGTGGASNLSGVFPKNTVQIILSPTNPSFINPSMIDNWLELTSVQSLSVLYWNSGNSNLSNIPLFHHMTQLKLFTTYFGNIPLTSWGVCDASIFPNIESLGFTFPAVGSAPVGDWGNISSTIKFVALGGAVGNYTQADTEHIAVSLANKMTTGPATIQIKGIQFVSTGYTANATIARNTLISKGYTVTP